MFLSVLKVLGVGLILFSFVNETISADDSAVRSREKAGSSGQKVRSKNVQAKGIVTARDQSSKPAPMKQNSSKSISDDKIDAHRTDQLMDAATGFARQPTENILDKKALPGTMSELLLISMPFPVFSPQDVKDVPNSNMRLASRTILPDSKNMDDAARGKQSRDDSLGSSVKNYRYLEIEVSHSGHTFSLYAGSPYGRRETLYECRVGLGGPGFPTPVGIYFVTHIYDDDPWWIPPKDRAWAAGDKPSRRVYGGTMAPLLKKRDVRSKKDSTDVEDKISGQVKLEDYGYRFHGTNSPRSIGHNQSHGCVRMLPNDAKKVASLIKEHIGTADRKESENGSYVVLKSPVRLNLVK